VFWAWEIVKFARCNSSGLRVCSWKECAVGGHFRILLSEIFASYVDWEIWKYSFVNRTIQLWNQLPEYALGTLSCKPSSSRKRVRKVINKVK
jgi:hypothetical protein